LLPASVGGYENDPIIRDLPQRGKPSTCRSGLSGVTSVVWSRTGRRKHCRVHRPVFVDARPPARPDQRVAVGSIVECSSFATRGSPRKCERLPMPANCRALYFRMSPCRRVVMPDAYQVGRSSLRSDGHSFCGTAGTVPMDGRIEVPLPRSHVCQNGGWPCRLGNAIPGESGSRSREQNPSRAANAESADQTGDNPGTTETPIPGTLLPTCNWKQRFDGLALLGERLFGSGRGRKRR